ncbi:MAG: SAM-dependent chlorinase/fluorinase [Nitrospirae bacterium]|nr:SAM-dependent chlorinase/fluorinase [Nitrospirota bacterium]
MLDKKPIITLTTDFGLKDPFAGLMKAVILGINPEAKLIDITHNISRHNVFEASQVLAMSYKYFPPATIHAAVVDPGVGGARRPLLVITEDHYFIGPDNGIFTAVFEKEQSGFFKVLNITASHYFLPMSGSTFHGRDVFAPVAAWLSKGVDSHKFGKQITDYHKISIPSPVLSDGDTIKGEVVSFDNFGNAISNITLEFLSKSRPADSLSNFKIIFRDRRVPLLNYYSEAKDHSLCAVINSFGRLELFANKDSAAEKFDIRIGDGVIITIA